MESSYTPTVSVVISARDEFPQIVLTVHAIVADLETWLKPGEFEIIIVDNCSSDERSWRFLMERGLYYHHNLKVLHDPIAGNVSARNKGAKLAKGKYLFFSDGHMSYKYGSFKAMVEALENGAGLVHPAVQWMGGWEPSTTSKGYTIRLGDVLRGTWNPYQVGEGKPFAVPVSGHCCLGVHRQEFLDRGGYQPFFRCYGGGEVYLDMKYWMLGRPVLCVPEAVGYHLSAGRGYSYHGDDHLHNMLLLPLALGDVAMAERFYIAARKEGRNLAVLDRMYQDAKVESNKDWHWLQRAHSLRHVLASRPWDQYNEKHHGKSCGAMVVFQPTWLASLSQEQLDLLHDSPDQHDLNKWLDENLSQFYYKSSIE